MGNAVLRYVHGLQQCVYDPKNWRHLDDDPMSNDVRVKQILRDVCCGDIIHLQTGVQVRSGTFL